MKKMVIALMAAVSMAFVTINAGERTEERLIAEGDALRSADPPDYPEAIAKFTQAERLLKVGHVGAARASERE